MAIDFDAIRKKLNQLSGVNNKRRAMWRPQEGETYNVRIIGFPNNDGNPFKERWFYYGIGNNPGLLTPNQFGKPDPIQELINKLRDEGTKEAYEMAKKLYPKMRTYAAVIVRGEENEGVRLWAFGKTVYQSLLNIIMDPDYGDITDVSGGHDIKVVCTKQPGRMYATTDIRPRPKESPLGTATQVKEWTAAEAFPDLDEIYTLKSYDELETVVNNWLNGEDEATGDTTVTENTSQRNSTPSKTGATNKPKNKTYNDIDDAFADLEDMDL